MRKQTVSIRIDKQTLAQLKSLQAKLTLKGYEKTYNELIETALSYYNNAVEGVN